MGHSQAGGGGWGAAGGKGYRGVTVSEQCQGGAAGKAVEDSGNTYTLTNNGTIYGNNNAISTFKIATRIL